MKRSSVYDLVDAERARQEELFPGCTIAAPTTPDLMRLRILVEEVGEVAEALDTSDANTKRELRKELVQVAACVIAWLETLDAPDELPSWANVHSDRDLRAALHVAQAQIKDLSRRQMWSDLERRHAMRDRFDFSTEIGDGKTFLWNGDSWDEVVESPSGTEPKIQTPKIKHPLVAPDEVLVRWFGPKLTAREMAEVRAHRCPACHLDALTLYVKAGAYVDAARRIDLKCQACSFRVDQCVTYRGKLDR